jgi:hypothetical protein
VPRQQAGREELSVVNRFALLSDELPYLFVIHSCQELKPPLVYTALRRFGANSGSSMDVIKDILSSSLAVALLTTVCSAEA